MFITEHMIAFRYLSQAFFMHQQINSTEKNNLITLLQCATPSQMLFLGAAIAVMILGFTFFPIPYRDWITIFRPAALNLANPYFDAGRVFNPPWLLVLLYPLALLPPRLGAAILMTISVLGIVYYVKSPPKIIAVMLSAPIMILFLLGQLDGLSLWALMFPPWLGLPFIIAKPQGVFLTSIRRLNIKSVGLTLGLFILSIIVWGAWWQNIIGYRPDQTVNLSLFPYSIPFGIALFYFGWKRKSDPLLALGSLCFSPYFMITSTLPAVAGLIKNSENRWVWVSVVVISWVYMLGMWSRLL